MEKNNDRNIVVMDIEVFEQLQSLACIGTDGI